MANSRTSSLQDFITGARERRDNEALADRIFSKGRNQSVPAPGGSLASRVGITKTRIPTGPRVPAPRSANGEWTHDLFSQSGDDTDDTRPRNSPASAYHSRNPAAARRANLARGLERAVSDPRLSQQIELMDLPSGIQPPRGPRAQLNKQQNQSSSTRRRDDYADGNGESPSSLNNIQGINIRGLAGPYTVMAQNLAPGTSTADIESAMMPVGGEMASCKIIKTSPIMVVEMVFVSKDGADAVVSQFNNKTADGRIIRVYHKVGGYTSNAQSDTTTAAPQTAAYDPQPASGHTEPRRSDSWQQQDQPTPHKAVVPGAVAPNDSSRDSRRGRYSDEDEPMDDGDTRPIPSGPRSREPGWGHDRSGPRNGGGGGGHGRHSNGRFYSDGMGGSNGRRGWAYDTRPDHSRGYRR